jgi:hypothetical protein
MKWFRWIDPTQSRYNVQAMIIEKLKKTQTKWNPMHAEHVASLWRAGHTAAHIADDLAKTHGIEKSRNSVISKLNTMGLLGTRSMRRQRKSTKSCSSVADVLAGMAARSGIFGKTYPLPPDEPIPATAVTLEDRRPDQCAWPVNHGGPFLYCGAHRNSRHAFCDHHAALAARKH